MKIINAIIIAIAIAIAPVVIADDAAPQQGQKSCCPASKDNAQKGKCPKQGSENAKNCPAEKDKSGEKKS